MHLHLAIDIFQRIAERLENVKRHDEENGTLYFGLIMIGVIAIFAVIIIAVAVLSANNDAMHHFYGK